MANDFLILDQTIVDDSIRIWTCFSDKNINKVLKKATSFQQLFESEALNGQEWAKLPFWGKVRDWVVPGKNLDGTTKGWFEDRKFPTRIIKAADISPTSLLKALNDGFNVKVDYVGATPEQSKAASSLLMKAFDREFLKAHAQAAVDASNVVGGAAAIGGNIVGGPGAGSIAGVASKGAVMDAEKRLVVDKFNDTVKGTEYSDLVITEKDMDYNWFDQLVAFVYAHPYATAATVIAMVLIWKNRVWIWDRLKLGFNSLWQGKIIAKYQFNLVNDEALSFEYDLRFNKWRLLYQDFKWKNEAYPSKSMIASFIKTEHCKKFIETCKKHMDLWFDHEDEIRNIVAMNEDPELKNPVKMILSVLDDKADILRTFTQLEYKVG